MEQDLVTRKYTFYDNNEATAIFGPQDNHLKRMEENIPVKMVPRGVDVSLTGKESDVNLLIQLFDLLRSLVKKGQTIGDREVLYVLEMIREGSADDLVEMLNEEIALNHKGKPIRVKTLGQRAYIHDIRKHDIVFGIGPAGTGKTYLAVVMAVVALRKGMVKKIILTRPAVEAGENLGFLPGDLQEKVDPYLRPLYDGLYDVYGPEQVQKAMERGLIEVAPLAYMRGRTLDEAFVILDEAQNTTPEQMKMFLTRLGNGSKMVITGDVTQIDLPRGKKSGLHEAGRILEGISEISFVHLTQQDVVRHPVVQKIISAYEQDSEQQ